MIAVTKKFFLKKNEIIFFLLFISIFSKIPEALIKTVKSPFQHELLFQPKSWLTNRFGENESLPLAVQEMHQLLTENQIQIYFLSSQIQNDPLLVQRSTESLYPVLPDKEAKARFYLKSEEVPQECNLQSSKELVTLAHCP